jgi:hypothetical protein
MFSQKRTRIYIKGENSIFSVSELLQFHHLHPLLLDASTSVMQRVQFCQKPSSMQTRETFSYIITVQNAAFY